MSLRNYSPLGMMTQNRAACGYHLGHLSHTADEVRWAAQHLMNLYKEGKIKPKIDSVWAFEEVGVAFLFSQKWRHYSFQTKCIIFRVQIYVWLWLCVADGPGHGSHWGQEKHWKNHHKSTEAAWFKVIKHVCYKKTLAHCSNYLMFYMSQRHNAICGSSLRTSFQQITSERK